jgi:hypothetical protein
VVFALDEVAGIAPLPGLPALAAEGGGQGLITLACLQDLSQARVRWGEAAEGFSTLFNTKVVFRGIGDHRTLQLISSLAGEHAVYVRSVNRPVQNKFLLFMAGRSPAHASVSTSVTWRPRLTVNEVSVGRPGCAQRIRGSRMDWVDVPAWWQHPIWTAVAHRTGSRFGELARPAARELPTAKANPS